MDLRHLGPGRPGAGPGALQSGRLLLDHPRHRALGAAGQGALAGEAGVDEGLAVGAKGLDGRAQGRVKAGAPPGQDEAYDRRGGAQAGNSGCERGGRLGPRRAGPGQGQSGHGAHGQHGGARVGAHNYMVTPIATGGLRPAGGGPFTLAAALGR